MDLLGRKAKAKLAVTESLLEQVVKAGERFKAQRDEAVSIAATQTRAISSELLSKLRSRDSLVSDLLLEVNQLSAEVERLSTPPKPSVQPLHKSEDETELEFQRDNNLISLQDYEHLLKELEFDNSTIELDPDFPRPDLY